MGPPAQEAPPGGAAPEGGDDEAESDVGSNGTDDFFPTRNNQKKKSLMKQVRDRIEKLPDIAPLQAKLELRKDTHAHRAATLAAISASLTIPELNHQAKAVEPRCHLSFRTALVGAIAATVLFACLGMFVPLVITKVRFEDDADTFGDATVQRQLDLVSGFINDAFLPSVLVGLGDSLRAEIQASSYSIADKLLGLLWPHALQQVRTGLDWNAGSCNATELLGNRPWPWTSCAGLSGSACDILAAPVAEAEANCTLRLSNLDSVLGPGQSNASTSLSAAPQRSWSEVWASGGSLRVAHVAEVMYVGGASPLHTRVAVVRSLAGVGHACRRHWDSLRNRLLTGGAQSPLSSSDSSLFVVSLGGSVSDPRQPGLVLGSAHAPPADALTDVSNSSDMAVREASQAILGRFGTWNAAAQHAGRSFRFGADGAARIVVTRRLELGEGASWLAVLSLPTAASPADVVAASSKKLVWPHSAVILRERLNEAWRVGVVALAAVALLGLGLALALGWAVASPLRQLDSLMQQLGDLDFSHEATKASLNTRSSIAEVRSLQRTFAHLSHAVEAFARFVPETVVRRIVRGDPRAARLHVSRRDVTIMFSDIRDFTAISEALAECDLLFVLTRYLSVMTRIVEYFNGVVAEVLGDGLLVFWNTPDEVPDHPAKGCQAALAMQQAVVFLNAEFARLKLPELAIRVGLHTGPVLSGNLGSEMKMKFGCLGDPINLASRLEGLCKFYGVGVICSGATHDALPAEYGLFCRKLDLVQVKGKKEATWIYELVGNEPLEGAGPASACSSADAAAYATQAEQKRAAFCKASSTAALDAIRRSTLSLCRTLSSLGDPDDNAGTEERLQALAGLPPDFVTPEQRSLAQLYEKALGAYQEARFGAARDLASELVEQHPEDIAAGRLLERVGKYASPDGGKAACLTEAELKSWTGVFVMAEK